MPNKQSLKKNSKSHKSVEEDMRTKINADRKKYNNSCNSALDERHNKSVKGIKKLSIKAKRNSINNLHTNKHATKENKENIKDFKNILK